MVSVKVCIDSDHDGWYYFVRPETYNDPIPESAKTRLPLGKTFDDIWQLALDNGHEISNAGWKRKLLSWNWYGICLDGYPGWELEGGNPAWCRLEHVNSNTAWNGEPGEHAGTPRSKDLQNFWDDLAKVHFYSRDYSYDGSFSVGNGEKYGSGWWFRTVAERDRFLAWVTECFPTVKIICRNASEYPESR